MQNLGCILLIIVVLGGKAQTQTEGLSPVANHSITLEVRDTLRFALGTTDNNNLRHFSTLSHAGRRFATALDAHRGGVHFFNLGAPGESFFINYARHISPSDPDSIIGYLALGTDTLVLCRISGAMAMFVVPFDTLIVLGPALPAGQRPSTRCPMPQQVGSQIVLGLAHPAPDARGAAAQTPVMASVGLARPGASQLLPLKYPYPDSLCHLTRSALSPHLLAWNETQVLVAFAHSPDVLVYDSATGRATPHTVGSLLTRISQRLDTCTPAAHRPDIPFNRFHYVSLMRDDSTGHLLRIVRHARAQHTLATGLKIYGVVLANRTLAPMAEGILPAWASEIVLPGLGGMWYIPHRVQCAQRPDTLTIIQVRPKLKRVDGALQYLLHEEWQKRAMAQDRSLSDYAGYAANFAYGYRLNGRPFVLFNHLKTNFAWPALICNTLSQADTSRYPVWSASNYRVDTVAYRRITAAYRLCSGSRSHFPVISLFGEISDFWLPDPGIFVFEYRPELGRYGRAEVPIARLAELLRGVWKPTEYE